MGRNSSGGMSAMRERVEGAGEPDGACDLSVIQAGAGSIVGMETGTSHRTADVPGSSVHQRLPAWTWGERLVTRQSLHMVYVWSWAGLGLLWAPQD